MWTFKKEKLLREKGQAYKGRKEVDGKLIFSIDRPEKNIKNIKCKCKLLTFHCSILSEEQLKNYI